MLKNANFIAGRPVPAASGGTLPVHDPASGDCYAQIADSDAEDIDLAVAAARRALEHGPWGLMSAMDRGRILSRFSQHIEARSAELAAIEAKDTGKPLSTAVADIAALARYFEFFGGAADKMHGEIIPYTPDHLVLLSREPMGVTGHILPWNYPAQMFGRSLAPALAMGNTTVLKPAEEACASILRLAEIASEAGLPEGALNIVTGRGATAGAALAAHPGVDFISFTGSPPVGQIIQKLAADHFIGCSLELGGKSPQLVFEDANLDAALPIILRAIIQNGGQTCSAGSRLLVQRSICATVSERLVPAFNAVRVGLSDQDLDCGPMITRAQQLRVLGFIDRARRDGIPLLAEGRIDPKVPDSGYFVTPALFGPVPRDHELAREEVFGPVLSLIPFDDEADAISLANATEYGLVAGVWTRDGARQIRVSKALRAGQVFVNCYGAGAGVELPFGGSGKSGHGREKGLVSLLEFSKTKTTVIHHG
ncbi:MULTISPECIES: aldehyde dehydrogenase family protein [unclassified Sphingomonas]|nr:MULTISPECIES: aldehyde dehydrogenase family protein [unclassified Sphingomonas]KQX19657.1 aldehyde dehydrogenase [Sphingomonas sp. Root1294]KQY65858.1 aldehyde dehydrogenase [Sphingomonas sp. Root50]KRB95565.1 aldehyde dehydrogenase [Sphingomonas sp. Root720]